MSIEAFESVYNEAKAHVEYLQTITFKVLKDIQQRHNYFEWAGRDIKEYLTIYWTDPVHIKFSPEKELPLEIKTEIEEKFLTVD